MAPHYPLYIARSDGQRDLTSKSKTKKELNRPTEAQLNKTPDTKGVSDYYTKLIPGSAKELDWRRKLGGMLMRELGGEEHKNYSYVLDALPDNFCLYEHVKYTTTDNGDLQKATNNHAKGPNDRQDAYLYGHPLGRKKRFRSPADFFPHLLWMVTDETGDFDNCTCKICSPDDFSVEDTELEGTSAVQSASGLGSAGKTATAAVDSMVPLNSGLASKNIAKTLSDTSASQSPMARPLATKSSTPPSLIKSSMGQPANHEQEADLQYGKYLFRPGELVWFSRGTAWGLSLIVNRGIYPNERKRNSSQYLLQPLSHPFSHPELRVISQENLLRPWLAWSAPGPTHQHLASGGFSYNTIDWTLVLGKQFGPGDAEVDASIFAAKAVDESYTLFDRILKPRAVAGELHWNGLYLGGEKIWVGEPVRLRIGAGSDIMVLHDIVEKSQQELVGHGARTVIYLIGDVYTFATVGYDERNQVPVNNPQLPHRLREDLRFRNRAIQKKNQICYWKMIRPSAKLGIEDIKGRWYESSLLLPILRTETDFNQDLARGEITDAGMWMNGRADSSLMGNRIGYRKANRIEAFGRAVPAGMQIGQAFDDLARAKAMSLQPGSSSNPVTLDEVPGNTLTSTEDNMEQFLDLNPVDGEYAHQFAGSGGHYFGDAMQR